MTSCNEKDRGSKFTSDENRAHFYRVLSCEKELISSLFRDCKCISFTKCAPEAFIWRNITSKYRKGKISDFDYLAGWFNPAFESLSRMR